MSFVILGGSGDLARRKIVPALFALFNAGALPRRFRIFGFGRTPYSDVAYREQLREHLVCRVADRAGCAGKIAAFLEGCHYHAGAYDRVDDFLDLFQSMRVREGESPANRVFYLAVPPEIFMQAARALGDSGLIACGDASFWSRVVVEKPFGYDRASSDRLVAEMARVFGERDTFRIDHYLGKELVQNLMVLRFANRIFEPVWHRDHIREVRITWREDLSLSGRAGYFDRAGIVRDVIQNHLLQILALIAMEPPLRFDSHAVRDAKVALLSRVKPPCLAEAVFGQYSAGQSAGGVWHPGYRDEPGVAPGSRTPTYAAIRLAVDTPRWQGVPFVLEAGKGVAERFSEVRILFHPLPRNIFWPEHDCPAPNELTIRIQPEEAIRLRIMGKKPGLAMAITPAELNLLYREQYGTELPDAYERLLLDVLAGERGLFIRSDELAAAWDIVTPLLKAWESATDEPQPYLFGSGGPVIGPSPGEGDR